MLSKNKLKLVRSLQHKKYRQKYNKFTVEGEKILTELLQQDVFEIDSIFATPSFIQTNEEILKFYLKKTITVGSSELRQLSSLSTPTEVVALVNFNEEMKAGPNVSSWAFYLDGIQNPGNLGTILRIADWFGWHQVFASPGSADLFNAKVLQASMGAFLRVRLHYRSLDEIQAQYPDLPLYGADMGGENVFTAAPMEPGLLLIGNEGKGLSAEARSKVDRFLSIPGAKGPKAESLNAAVAAGILCAQLSNPA
ncbi:MAG: RNA methyltransferase [Bacteroidota bacterium]